MQVALQQSATDPATGTIDMECITTGMTSTDRRAREQLANELRELLKSKKHALPACLECKLLECKFLKHKVFRVLGS